MRRSDTFLQWLNPTFMEAKPGYCKIEMPVRTEFLNHVGTLHGGITFSLADAAFAYAANAHNRVAVALNVSITYPNAGRAGDILTAIATEDYLGDKTAVYRVEVKNQRNEMIGIFNGMVYRKKELHIAEE